MWDRFFRQRAYIGITRSRMRWHVRKNYLTCVNTIKILIYCARIHYVHRTTFLLYYVECLCSCMYLSKYISSQKSSTCKRYCSHYGNDCLPAHKRWISYCNDLSRIIEVKCRRRCRYKLHALFTLKPIYIIQRTAQKNY